METLSLEYCHIYPGRDIRKEIQDANCFAPKVLRMFEEYEVQKCIMLDDINGSGIVDMTYIKSIVGQLTIKPDCMYLESSFVSHAHDVIKSIDPRKRDFIHSDERLFLREMVKKYNTTTEFLLSWKNSHGQEEFSCPTLTATSYLTRLGYLPRGEVKVVYGAKMKKCSAVLNMLPSQYLSVENDAQSIIEAVHPEAVQKIKWFFY